MKKELITIFAILLIGLASADFEIGNLSHSIEKSYRIGDELKGWMNISLINESVDSLLEDSLGNSIKLISLLREQKIDYSCTSPDCSSNYFFSNGATTKNFDLNEGESKLLGIVFNENMNLISSVNFSITSSASSSCNSQIKIDILNDGIIDSENTKASNDFCSSVKNRGCFDLSEQASEGEINQIPYCQKIYLDEAPEFEIGAWVKKTGDANEVITMSLYNLEGDLIKACNLQSILTEGSEVSCIVNYSNTKLKNYLICVNSNGNSGNYKTKGYSKSDGCGYKDIPGEGDENYAYQIFAREKRFDAVGNLRFQDTQQLIESYINSKYPTSIEGNINCTNKCIIPIKIYSGEDQNIILESLSAKYGIGGGLTKETNLFYDLTESSSEVNFGFKKIYLNNASFELPSIYKNITYILKLNGEKIFSEKISIEKEYLTIKGLYPRTTASGYPTRFVVSVDSGKNISKYKWEFGDGNAKETFTKDITHTYNSTGNYNLKITTTDSKGLISSETFSIAVGSAKNFTNSLLETNKKYLSNVSNQIKSMDIFYQSSLESVLDLKTSGDILNDVQKKLSVAVSEDDYKKILAELLELKIPKSVRTIMSTSSITFSPNANVINLDIIKNIGGGDYESSKTDLYFEEILAWNQENMNTKIVFKEFSAEYDDYEESVLRIFEVSVEENEYLSSDPYLILENLENLKFKENYKEEEISEYTYITLEHPEQIIIFSTTENVDFTNLPMFISPKLDKLDIASKSSYSEADDNTGRKWFLFGLIFILIIIIATITYLILQEWYKRKYENKLFENKNKLYNLIVFIENSKKKGKTDEEISNELKKAGWNSEQIDYALKKHSGKRTGMIELPFFGKIFEMFSKKKEAINQQK